MIPEDTLRRRCTRCRKVVLIPSVTPCRNKHLLNGIWLTRMDENFRTHNVGYLCFECAFCLPWEKSTIPSLDNAHFGLGFGGGKIGDLDLWEATIT